MPPLYTCVEIDGIAHDRAPGEGAVTRCRIPFLERIEVSYTWPGWRIGRLLEQGTPVDCMTCLVRASR
jgi:hypothetical protein